MKFPIIALIALFVSSVPCHAGHIDDQGIIVFGPEHALSNADSVLTASLPDTLSCPHPWWINGEQVTSPFIVTWDNHVLCVNNVQAWPYVFPETETAEVTEYIQKKHDLNVKADEAAAQVQSKEDKSDARWYVYETNMFQDDAIVAKMNGQIDGRMIIYWTDGHADLIGSASNSNVRPRSMDQYQGALSVYKTCKSTARYDQIYILSGSSDETLADTGAALEQLQGADSAGSYVPGPISRRSVDSIIGRD